MQNLTEEQKADVIARMADFKKEYLGLVEKYQTDFMAAPQYIEVQPGIFASGIQMQLMDKKYLPVPSPLQSTIKEK